jgi:hypothetical protein
MAIENIVMGLAEEGLSHMILGTGKGAGGKFNGVGAITVHPGSSQ